MITTINEFRKLNESTSNDITSIYENLLNDSDFKKFYLYLDYSDGFDLDPYELTHGFCDLVAYYVSRKLPGTEIYRTEIDNNLLAEKCGHVFIKYNNKYFDYDNPTGVTQPSDLKYFEDDQHLKDEINNSIETDNHQYDDEWWNLFEE